jgi:hypothetical protein
MKQKEKPTTSELDTRTEADNKRTINRLLNLYDIIVAEFAMILQDPYYDEIFTLADKLNMFKTLTSTIDLLIKRWNIIHQGYDTNPKIAYAKEMEKSKEENSNLQNTRGIKLHPDMKSAVDNLSKLKDESYPITMDTEQPTSNADIPDT